MKPGTVTFREVTLGYERHPAVHALDGTIGSGDMLAIVGPNGAGKSTLLKGIVGEIKPLEGSIACGSADGEIAYLPQAAEVDRSFPLSVLDLVAMGLWRRFGPWRGLGSQRPALLSALARVGLSGFEQRSIGTLSGGQFQRALFARLILQDASTILLDEPFTGIDVGTVDDLFALIHAWQIEGRTIVAALHDPAQVRAHFPATLLLSREMVAWGPTATVLTGANLARARRSSEAWDENAQVCRRDHHNEPMSPPLTGRAAERATASVPGSMEPEDHAHRRESVS